MNHYERIIDVNINRLSEGFRTIEDVTRFILEDDCLFQKLKNYRHEVRKAFPVNNIIHTKENEDIGQLINTKDELIRRDWKDILIASFKRVEESLRVLEEVSKIIQTHINFKSIRFSMYKLEKYIIIKLEKFCRFELKTPTLYLVLSEEHCHYKDPVEIALAAAKGGIDILQLRAKSLSDKAMLNLGQKLKEVCVSYNVKFIINDRPDIAMILNADGVHLGQDDISPEQARLVIGQSLIIGFSCHNIDQLEKVDVVNVDYASLGPIFPTQTKDNLSPSVGISELADIQKHSFPVVVIGGINSSNLKKVIKSGCSRIAMVTGITMSSDITKQVIQYKSTLIKEEI